jgi:putative transposase
LARLHARIANIRADFVHKLTTRLCRENQAVAIEDVNVNNCVTPNLKTKGGYQI